METFLVFMIKVTCCLSVFYLIGKLLYRNDTAFKIQRIYFWASILLSISLPFNPISITIFKDAQPKIIQTQKPFTTNIADNINPEVGFVKSKPALTPIKTFPSYSPVDLITKVYWIIVAIGTLRIFYSFLFILVCIVRYPTIRRDDYAIVLHPSIKSSFSFFRWVFISGDEKSFDDYQHIIKHEMVHADQYHSFDVITIELLSAVMWFNPFIWLMRKDIQQLHEYLADEGVVNSGINVLEYQTLLVNQVAGDRLISLPSGFSQTLIKKRLAMMTKTSSKSHRWYRLIAVIPLTGIMFVILSFTNKGEVSMPSKSWFQPLLTQNTISDTTKNKLFLKTTKQVVPPAVIKDTVKSKRTISPPNNASDFEATPPPPPEPGMVTAVAPTKMNVFYLGADNPVSIAVSGVPSNKIFPSISNGTIQKMGNNYVVHPQKLGVAVISVTAEIDGKIVPAGTLEFRVKRIPDPVAKVAGKKGGSIDRNTLLTQTMVLADLENFDFDLRFDVVEFAIAGNIKKGEKTIVYFSKSSKITDEQKSLIKEVPDGEYVYFQDIKVVGPDGKVRELPAIAFTIKD